jgi:hypothetical protein
MALFGPVFEVGERIDWADPKSYTALFVGEGPFTVATVYNNEYPNSCACGSQDTTREHFPSDEHPCGDVPAQFVTIRNMKGELIGAGDHKPPRYRSAYFKKAA